MNKLTRIKDGKKYRLYVDMDGVLTKWNNELKDLSELYEKGYFYNLEPQTNVLLAFKNLQRNPDIELHILSAVLKESKYAAKEKALWLDVVFGEVDKKFVFADVDKVDAVKNIDDFCFLFDDYNVNLMKWENSDKTASLTAIKVLNGINIKDSWQGSSINAGSERTPEEIEESIISAINKSILSQKVVLDSKIA